MKRKKRLKIIIFILLIIMVILLVNLISYLNKRKESAGRYSSEELEMIEENIDNYLSDKITPKGISKLYGNYKGENDLNDIYRSIYKFVNYLPILANKVDYNSVDSIKNYYDANRSEIKDIFGISNLEEFTKLIENLNEIEYKGQKFIDSQIDSTTFKNEKSYFSFDIKFNFEKIEKEFKIKLNFSNHKYIQPLVYYSIIEE